jgi:integrase
MGHIQDRRLEGRGWRARYRGPDHHERSRTFKRKIDAERFLVAVESSKLRGEWIDPRLGKTTFGEWASRWMTTTVGLKPKTRQNYESLLRAHVMPAFGRTPLATIQPVDVREWVARLSATGLSSSRVRQAYQLFSMIMKGGVESGYLARTPCVGIRIPRAPKREQLVLEPRQIDLLAGAAREYGVLIYVLAYGGLRWGEAAALRRGRCDLLRARIEVAESLADVSGELHFGPTKSYARRWARLPRAVCSMLAFHLQRNVPDEPDALVFTATEGGPLRYNNFRNRAWTRALRQLDDELPKGLSIHHLRHTCASLLIREGASVKAVQEQLGHSSPTVTLGVYAHLFDDDLDRLFEKVDSVFTRSAAAPPRPETNSTTDDALQGSSGNAS